MSVQVLVATMNQQNHELIHKMNIQSDAIIGNQCDHNSVEQFEVDGNIIFYLNFVERGVGLNRNNALMRATGDICLFADDDMIYVDGYKNIIEEAFHNNPEADVIVLNLIEENTQRKQISKKTRVSWYNYLRFGTARIAFKLDKVKQQGIYFNQCFGGGTEHCHGEDNLFLTDCLKKGLKIIALPISVARLTNSRDSTWDVGYDVKYFKDQGALYRTISRRWWKLLCLQDSIRCAKYYKTKWYQTYKIMKKGGDEI